MGIGVERAWKHFGGFTALENVSLQVRDGSLTALLGPSDGGKSTLLRVIAGLEAPDRGRVIIDGNDATPVPARKCNANVWSAGAETPAPRARPNARARPPSRGSTPGARRF
jgi:ABC-type sugar transport system ATPase subunit